MARSLHNRDSSELQRVSSSSSKCLLLSDHVSIWVRLVELIVLNIGLAAGILSVKVFSMFVLEGMSGEIFTPFVHS